MKVFSLTALTGAVFIVFLSFSMNLLAGIHPLACEIPDGVYKAKVKNGNVLSFTVYDQAIVKMTIFAKQVGISSLFSNQNSEYEPVHFKYLLSGCNTLGELIFAWQASNSTEGEDRYFHYSPGIFVFSFDQGLLTLKLKNIKAGNNNVALMMSSEIGHWIQEITLNREEDLPGLIVADDSRCAIPEGQYKMVLDGWSFYLSVDKDKALSFVQGYNGLLKFVPLSEVDDLIAGCNNRKIILAWKKRTESGSETRLFAGKYSGYDDAIYSEEERFLIMQSELEITSGVFYRVADMAEDFGYHWLDFLSQ